MKVMEYDVPATLPLGKQLFSGLDAAEKRLSSFLHRR
jgi:hypothetical protein